jgi:hypothetical protein
MTSIEDQESGTPGDPVLVTLTRWDLAWFQLRLSSSPTLTWRRWLVAAVCLGIFVVWNNGVPTTALSLVTTVALITLVLAAFWVLGVVISLCVATLWTGASIGVLGTHTYSFQPDGLRERTTANDTLIRWGGVQDVHRIGELIVIRISPALYHVLPRRSFDTPEAYERFWQMAQRLKPQRGRARD